MAIKFLRAHIVNGPPKLTFEGGQVVKDRDDASELHFVRRGHAAYLDEKTGKLTDQDGNDVVDPFPKAKAGKAVTADDGDGLDKLTGAKLTKVVKDENITVAEGADDAAMRTAIRAHRQAALAALREHARNAANGQ
jgi:hypothetical protein